MQPPTSNVVVESSDNSDSEDEGPLASGLTPQRHPHPRGRKYSGKNDKRKSVFFSKSNFDNLLDSYRSINARG